MEILFRLSYSLEIFLGEWVFLQAYPQRKHFWLRLAIAFAVVLAVGYCLDIVGSYNQMTRFICYLTLITLSIFCACMTVEGSIWSILASCVAGVACQHIAHHISMLLSMTPWIDHWSNELEFAVVVPVYILMYLIVGRYLKKNRFHEYHAPRVTLVSLVIVLVCTGITRILRLSGVYNEYVLLASSLYAITTCSLALFCQFFLYHIVRIQKENLIFRRIQAEEQRQYQFSKETAELLNIKSHDLKHKLLSLEGRLPQSEIDSMRSIIETYDNVYHTGNETLDIILNEKCRSGATKGVSITCMGDGNALSFMDTMDLYSLFGNILDNALTAAAKLSTPEKRLVSLVIERHGSLIHIDAMNFMDSQPLTFRDGLPDTTKADAAGHHGYGLKSVRAIARKYRGDVAITTGEEIFRLRVYLVDSSGDTDPGEA